MPRPTGAKQIRPTREVLNHAYRSLYQRAKHGDVLSNGLLLLDDALRGQPAPTPDSDIEKLAPLVVAYIPEEHWHQLPPVLQHCVRTFRTAVERAVESEQAEEAAEEPVCGD